MKHTDPRRLALEVLHRWRQGNAFVDEVLDECLAQAHPTTADAALVRHLVMTVVKLHGTLDHVISAFSRTPIRKIDPPVLDALRLGLAQLIYSDGIPDHAAVNETVDALSHSVKKHVVGFCNGILRSVARSIVRNDLHGPRHTYDRRRLPRDPDHHVLMNRAVLPEAHSPTEALAAMYGYPPELVQALSGNLDEEQLEQVLALGNRPPVPMLRPDRMPGGTAGLARHLAERNIDAEVLENGLVRPNNWNDEVLSGLLASGNISVQDHAAWEVTRAVADLSPTSVLDVCAAPGGKAVGIALLLEGKATVVAVDVNPSRLETVRQNVARAGLDNVEMLACDGRLVHDVIRRRFDVVLVDAPCSNTGVLRKRAEARHRFGRRDLDQLVRLQLDLLDSAVKLIGPKGHLCYSTCSIVADENEHVVDRFGASHEGVRVVRQQRFIPDESGADGGFYSIMEVEGSAAT